MEYTPMSKVKTVQQKQCAVAWSGRGIWKFYLPVKNKTNFSTNWKKTQARCQVGNKVMKTKLINMLRGKERKKE